MKTILLALIASSLCAQAQYLNLTTRDGATYTDITAQRVDPDGLYIEYTLPGGGFGVSKIKFARLSRAEQKKFGFDPAKAYDYEEQVAQANEDCSQALIHRYQAERDARLQRDRENEAAYGGRMAAIRQLNAAQAALELSSGGSIIGDGHGGAGIGYSSQATTGNVTSTQTTYGPAACDPFPNRGISIRGH
jgi:hypothetical protein